MIVASELLCRAEGKICEKLLITMQDDHKLRVLPNPNSTKPDIPCQLFFYGKQDEEKKTYVAVYPILPVAQGHYHLGEFDSADVLVSSYKHDISYRTAKWQSRMNYRLRGARCAEIRCCEKTLDPISGMGVSFFQAISSPTHIILRAKLTLGSPTMRNLQISCINARFENVPVSYMKLDQPQTTEGFITASPSISLSVPWNQGDLYFTFSLEGNEAETSIVPLSSRTYEHLIKESDQTLYNDAGRDPYYQEWLGFHRVMAEQLAMQRAISSTLDTRFSIIVPLFNTPTSFFSDMLNSVLEQSYPHWELILVNASPANHALNEAIEVACAGDNRIRHIKLEENYGITRNTARGISAANGSFICFFDHDDILEPDALFEYAQVIADNEKIDVLYCDEDKLMPDGTFATPFFKPDFNIDLLRSNNYICHLLCMRATLLNMLHFEDAKYDGAQDHNLILQAAEHTKAFHHVPRVLYHWRISDSSTAGDNDAKPYAANAGRLAVQAHLDRLDIPATVTCSQNKAYSYDVVYDTPADNPLVSIIIPTKDRVDLLRNCIDSIVNKSTYQNYEIVIIDNQSNDDATAEFYASLHERYEKPTRVSYWNDVFNFAGMMNYGRREAQGSYLLFLNNDTEVISERWIESMLGICARRDVGVVGAKLYYPDDTIQHAGVVIARNGADHLFRNLPREQLGYFNLADTQRNCSAVTAACMMTSCAVFDLVGGFDEQLQITYNDVDYCLKVHEAGLLTVYSPLAELYHFESVSRNDSAQEDAVVKFVQETGLLFYRYPRYFALNDPYGTPNVSRDEDACAHYRF